MKTNTILLVAVSLGLGVGGVMLFQKLRKPADAPVKQSPISNPLPAPKSDSGIFGSGLTVNDIVTIGGLF